MFIIQAIKWTILNKISEIKDSLHVKSQESHGIKITTISIVAPILFVWVLISIVYTNI